MKKIQMALMALATISGIGGAFAFGSKAHFGTSYYAVKNGSSFVWTTVQPAAPKSCQTTLQVVACTINTTTAPTDGVFPSGQTSTSSLYK